MKANIIDKTGKSVGDFTFENVATNVREDVFKKAVLAEFSLFRQEKGAKLSAGKRQTINNSKRRKAFRSTYGKGGSRTPKKAMWARGSQIRFVGAFVSNTRGGRRAHPPKAAEKIMKSMNNKEWNFALLTGYTASLNKDLVAANGQRVPENYPIVLDNSVEEMTKTADFKALLKKIGFEEELDRTSERKIRAGRGTMRNRTYKVKRGPLVVVSSSESPLVKAARNIQGFDVVSADLLLACDFGMSEKPGRAVIFTQKAAEEFKEVINS
ncbi:MAG: 50S ribosomal protein L4 [Nanoarchaeales archaeon]|nr:50S ribosomal protein L4 [Nanoarchaeales archaeon]